MQVFSYDFDGMKQVLPFESFTFSGGEEHIRFSQHDFSRVKKVEIVARLTNAAGVMRLMMAADALNRLTAKQIPVELVMPYFPYARQDRVCVTGEALGASVMATLINQCQFAKVTVWDVHSDVSAALLQRVQNVSQTELLKSCPGLWQRLASGKFLLVAPDAGASKKIQHIAAAFGGQVGVVQAHKARNLKTGEIEKTEIYGQVAGRDVLIVDDICDGGRTFIELAKVLKEKGAGKISLFVTHGIFSQGLEVFEGVIDEIYTTDSFRSQDSYIQSSGVQFHVINRLG
ncbi:Ribose-phosphate pyrophosphokinase 2 [Vibrio aerogenes CECT 7868]|uniref:Ribose-phosphate pyrophosphokinase 2 n=1 Tax=Vibrio aerogenes CECT 7868 TaxID=1216006 RepID=A0A1M5WDE2_9VIBR|nr:ribose-phosphate diphosphokinase [Vibrio aerogenes]SHH85525.1 Ribose-phosphate pyrophosphokinase 2 [Vibrio aerogenes CECT 7868]